MTIKEIINTKNDKISIDKITKKFYENFKKEYKTFLDFINGIPVKFDQEWYASLMLNRLMFIYFIQRKGFLNNDYLLFDSCWYEYLSKFTEKSVKP